MAPARVRLLDGTQTHAKTSVLVRDRLIAQVRTEVSAPAGTPQLNCCGMILLPGLVAQLHRAGVPILAGTDATAPGHRAR